MLNFLIRKQIDSLLDRAYQNSMIFYQNSIHQMLQDQPPSDISDDMFAQITMQLREDALNQVSVFIFGVVQASTPEVYSRYQLAKLSPSVSGVPDDAPYCAGTEYCYLHYAFTGKSGSSRNAIKHNHIFASYIDQTLRSASTNINDPEFIKEAEAAGLTPLQYHEILKLEQQNIGKPSNYERVKKQRNALSVFTAVLSVALLICVFPIANKKYNDGYANGYDLGYETGVQDTKTTYSKPSNSGSATVYIIPSGTKYHEKGCTYLNDNGIAISLKDAKQKGYTACSKCNPPGSSYSSSTNSDTGNHFNIDERLNNLRRSSVTITKIK